MNLFNTDVPPVDLKYTNSHQHLLGVYYLIQILILSFWRVCTHRQLLVKWFTERSLRAELRDVKKLHTRTVLLQSESNWITFQKPLHSYLTYHTIIWFLDALIEKNQCILLNEYHDIKTVWFIFDIVIIYHSHAWFLWIITDSFLDLIPFHPS